MGLGTDSIPRTHNGTCLAEHWHAAHRWGSDDADPEIVENVMCTCGEEDEVSQILTEVGYQRHFARATCSSSSRPPLQLIVESKEPGH